MKTYNPKDWYSFFRLDHADTLKKLYLLIIFVAAYSWLVVFLEIEYFRLLRGSYVSNITIMHTLLSFAISMLLVFRTNTAYDRWWEGRKLWGTLVNTSRNLAIKLNAILDPGDHANRKFFRKCITMYASVLSHHLDSEQTRLALDEKEHPELAHLDNNKHVPNQVAGVLIARINRLYEEGKIKGDQLIIINHELETFTNVCGACERIKNTPIPFSYSTFLKRFIFIYVVTLPYSLAFSLGYLTVPVVALIFYVLATLELIAEEIEDPFGSDSNDLPTQKIADNIRKHVGEILV
ncbi:MAG TPA: bestrophin family protein [Flavitalea sp.]|nr:bestrophin family protein [Flavitalea sp.]